ncbi:hypothetical protein HHI36_020064 [Cryptolaemus montrouzieri]|uniref:Ig-like domain-containing protein n=1 Tax=Cryptolaemus montrouzieri TaxID=559131 RepID=A0ABD2N9H6_9CUCU
MNFLAAEVTYKAEDCQAFGVLRIKEVNIPTSVKSGEVNEIVLDCDFIADNETGIVVKWFYNGDKDQIYQWIAGSNGTGSPMGSLKDYIDASYKASNENISMYRALKLVNVTHKLTGSYSCKVTGDTDEIVQTKYLTIFVPPSEGLNLTVVRDDLSAICSVYGVFPEPKISLYLQKQNHTNTTSQDRIEEEVSQDESFFNKTTILSFSNDTTSTPSHFVCEMSIPGTEYGITEKRLFSIDNSSIQPHPSVFLLHSSLVLIFSILLKY